jgi:DNA polymerase III subunit delta
MLYKSYLLEQNIKGLEKKFNLFFGENLGLKNDLKKTIKRTNESCEILNLYQDDILKDQNKFFSEINNISLFQKKKIYFIDQVNDKILEIVKEIEPIIDTNKIFLFADLLDKKSKIRNHFESSKNLGLVPCYPDNQIGIRKIIIDKLKGFDGLSPENINLIVDNSNLDRTKLNNELEKILIFFHNKKIETEKLEIILDTKTNDDFNILRDKALCGIKKETNKLLSETVFESEKSNFYINAINQRLNKLLDLFSFKEKNLESAMSKLKPPVFWKDKENFIAQAKKWNISKIKFFLKETYNLEIEIKSNATISKNILIKKLIIDLCAAASS